VTTPDTLLVNAVVVPMDGTRRIIDRGHVLVRDGHIAAVGEGRPSTAPEGCKTIEMDGAILIPGLIDLHLHAGHGLTKGLGGSAAAWMGAVGDIYARHGDAEFWGADAALQALERLRGGVTTAVPFFGGGDNVMRSHDPACADAHLREIERAGLREVLVLGVDRPPFPRAFRDWDGGRPAERAVSLADQIAGADETIRRWSGAAGGRIALAVSAPVGGQAAYDAADAAVRRDVARGVGDAWALSRRHGLRFVQDGHRDGTIDFMADAFGLFDRTSVLAHCIDLTEGDIETLQRTGAAVAYTPSSLMSVFGTCPAPRLRRLGLRVGLGTDGPAPDRPLDMFRTMFMAHRVQAIAARDETVLDAWDMLGMATRDAARALGLEGEIGSIAVGLRADIVAVQARAAHLWPPDQPVGRLAFYANAADVGFVMVDGRILMQGRSVLAIDPEAVLDRAADAYARMLERAGLAGALPR
jgi:cytosine/adenosine deaminase-related metal-dependent hydrolase